MDSRRRTAALGLVAFALNRGPVGPLLRRRLLLPPVGVRCRPMLFDQDEHKRTMKVVAIVLAVVFLIGMFALGGVLLFT